MYMSQEMLKLRRFLARFWLCDNQMTIIFGNDSLYNVDYKMNNELKQSVLSCNYS